MRNDLLELQHQKDGDDEGVDDADADDGNNDGNGHDRGWLLTLGDSKVLQYSVSQHLLLAYPRHHARSFTCFTSFHAH